MISDRFYLDFNATSPLSVSVLDWLKSGEVLFANPASQHSLGKASRKVINEARATIYRTFGKQEGEHKLFFHSGATEALQTFAYSFADVARLKGAELLVCYSRIDHPAVTSLVDHFWGPHVKFLELKHKKDLSYNHQLNLELIRDRKENNPDLMILYHHLWVHNETGLVSPLEELRELKTIPDLYIHVDAVQAPGKIPEWRELGVGDIWSFSAHKFGALKGIGFSLFHRNLPFRPLITGGGQQQGMRSGTENPQGVRSVELALRDLEQCDVKLNQKHRARLEAFLEQELQGIGGVLKGQRHNANTIYFYLNNLTSDVALALFDLHGLMISAGSACSSGTAKESAVLMELGLKRVAKNGLRLSFGFQFTEQQLIKIEECLRTVFLKLRKVS